MQGLWTGLGAGTAALLAVAAPALAQNYTFTNVVDSTGEFASFQGARLNNAGAVSFTALHDTFGSGVFRHDGTTLTTIADTTGPYAGFGNRTDINDAGQVAYTGISPAGVRGAYRGDGAGLVATIADSTGFLGDFRPHVRINAGGTVAFSAVTDGAGGSIGYVMAGNGAGTPTIVGIVGSTDSTAQTPELNDLGLVSHGRMNGSTVPTPTVWLEMVTGNGGTTSVLADSLGPYQIFGTIDGAPVNNASHVLFLAQRDTGEIDLLLHDGSGLDPLVSTADGVFAELLNPELNESGGFAFAGLLANGERGIFAGADPATDTVLLQGQPLFGSVAASLTLGGINDAGQIVFHYGLANGRSGIAVATLVPEPTVAGLAVGVGLLALRRRSRRA